MGREGGGETERRPLPLPRAGHRQEGISQARVLGTSPTPMSKHPLILRPHAPTP